MTNTRREFLLAAGALWRAAVASARQHHQLAPASVQPYTFTFLEPGSRETLRTLMDRIAPADERSAGAVGARVDEYIDFILTHAERALQQQWQTGLIRYRASIQGHSPMDVDAFLTKQAENEFRPRTEDERFFVLLKYAVIEGFYTSEEGITKELGYQGMGFVLDFKGCTHERHDAPDGWKPLLQQQKA
jgi:hypothetical protein